MKINVPSHFYIASLVNFPPPTTTHQVQGRSRVFQPPLNVNLLVVVVAASTTLRFPPPLPTANSDDSIVS